MINLAQTNLSVHRCVWEQLHSRTNLYVYAICRAIITSLDVYFAHSGKFLDKADNYLSVRKAMRSGE